jgi:hypothetical protein
LPVLRVLARARRVLPAMRKRASGMSDLSERKVVTIRRERFSIEIDDGHDVLSLDDGYGLGPSEYSYKEIVALRDLLVDVVEWFERGET